MVARPASMVLGLERTASWSLLCLGRDVGQLLKRTYFFPASHVHSFFEPNPFQPPSSDPTGHPTLAQIIAWSGTIAAITFAVLKWWGALRVDEETEDMGMDAKSHSPPKAYALPTAA